MTVLTWNIHRGQGLANEYDLGRIADRIDRCDPDVVALQEVDRTYGSRSDFDDQIERLASRLDMGYRFGGNVVREPTAESEGSLRRYGIATLWSSACSIESSQHHLLPKISYEDRASERRGLVETSIERNGATVGVYNTHLALTADQRRRQVNALLDIAARHPDPQVVVGDFNATPDSSPIARIQERYRKVEATAEDGTGQTFPAGDPDRQIDYVFVTPDVRVIDATTIRTSASDHRPVRATLEVPEPTR